MSTYDAIIVLGSKPNTTSWRFPTHVYKSLDVAAELWHQNISPYIIVAGNYALSFDKEGVQQPFRECDELAQYLRQQRVSDSAILCEGESKDTIANFFYVKRLVLHKRNFRRLILVTADFRVNRLQYLIEKILGPNYEVDCRAVPSLHDEASSYNESLTLARTREFLQDMPNGDESFLEDKFYDAPYYKFVSEANGLRR